MILARLHRCAAWSKSRCSVRPRGRRRQDKREGCEKSERVDGNETRRRLSRGFDSPSANGICESPPLISRCAPRGGIVPMHGQETVVFFFPGLLEAGFMALRLDSNGGRRRRGLGGVRSFGRMKGGSLAIISWWAGGCTLRAQIAGLYHWHAADAKRDDWTAVPLQLGKPLLGYGCPPLASQRSDLHSWPRIWARKFCRFHRAANEQI
jgi:hypothetical protein